METASMYQIEIKNRRDHGHYLCHHLQFAEITRLNRVTLRSSNRAQASDQKLARDHDSYDPTPHDVRVEFDQHNQY